MVHFLVRGSSGKGILVQGSLGKGKLDMSSETKVRSTKYLALLAKFRMLMDRDKMVITKVPEVTLKEFFLLFTFRFM